MNQTYCGWAYYSYSEKLVKMETSQYIQKKKDNIEHNV